MIKYEYQVIYVKGKPESELKAVFDNYGKLGYRIVQVILPGSDVIMEKIAEEEYPQPKTAYFEDKHVKAHWFGK